MIARFQTFIPFLIFVQADLQQQADPEEITVGSIRALIYPLHHSKLRVGDVSGESETPPNEVPRRLDPADPQSPAPLVQIGDGPAIVGDVLRIDLHADQFDRNPGAGDSLVNLAFNLANSWLRRFKTLSRIPWATTLDKTQVPWKLDVLNDDGTAVEKEEGRWRTLLASVTAFKCSFLDAPIWDAITSLPTDYEPQPSDELLLDAYALLPQVGPAVVLAHTAVETRVAQTLDRQAVLTGLNPELWSWLTDRGDFTKDPSTAEQLDRLAKALTGKSLKDDQRLWEGFQHLREARNKFVHEGKATLGRSRTPVDSSKAAELVQSAEKIIDWLENLLPQAERRPRFQSPNQATVGKLLVALPSETVSDDAQSEPAESETA
jgi:hypothetical protein